MPSLTIPSGLTFLQPAGLWLLGLIPVIVLIHLLRANPRRQPVPSVFLWQGLELDTTATRRWRPPPPTLLLLLQILTVGVVALAVAGPRVAGASTRHLFLLLDASASMLATDAAPSRFDEAVRRANRLLDGLGPGDRVTVVRVGPTPRVVAADADAGAARDALGDLEAGAGSAAMREALLLTSSLAARAAGDSAEAVVLTDGAFADPGELGSLSLPVRFETVGSAAENLAISSLAVAREPRPNGGVAALARVVNFGDRPARVPVRLLTDDTVQDVRDVDVPARGRADLQFAVPGGVRRVAAALVAPDALPVDNWVDVAVAAGQARQVRLVSRLPDALERALRAIPDLQVEVVPPERYAEVSSGRGEAELVVLDGFLPERLPRGQVLIVNPPAGRDYLPVRGELRSVAVRDIDGRHPLLEGVDLSAVRLTRAAALELPTWGRAVVEGDGGPLIFEGTEAGRALVVMAFDPVGSGVDKLIAYPLLISNAIAFLAGGDLTPALPAGRTATLPVRPGVRDVRLELPDGTTRALEVDGTSVRLAGLELPGRYTVRERGGAAGEERTFAINVADEAESQIAPRPWPAVQAGAVRTAPAAGGAAPLPTTARELWPILLAVGLALFGAEWWRFGRRG